MLRLPAEAWPAAKDNRRGPFPSKMHQGGREGHRNHVRPGAAAMEGYLVLKWLHVLGAVLLLGNVVVTGVWSALLYRARREVGFRSIARGILWTDLAFTLVGGILLTLTGVLMARASGLPIFATPWVRHGAYLLGASTLLWLVFLLPDQFRMDKVDPSDDAQFRRLFLRWSLIGWFSTALLFGALWVMVTKR